MFFRKIFIIFAFFLLFGGLFAFRGQRQYQHGYAQGYVAGQQAAQSVGSAEDGSTAVPAPTQPTAPLYQPGFSFFTILFKMFTFFFGFMLLLALMRVLFGSRRWRHGRGWHHAPHWGKWHHHKQSPPWYSQDDAADEPIMKA